MKNEAPYIVEWIAYHRAIGVDNFLIYTNDCADSTDEVLGRLMELGIVQLHVIGKIRTSNHFNTSG